MDTESTCLRCSLRFSGTDVDLRPNHRCCTRVFYIERETYSAHLCVASCLADDLWDQYQVCLKAQVILKGGGGRRSFLGVSFRIRGSVPRTNQAMRFFSGVCYCC